MGGDAAVALTLDIANQPSREANVERLELYTAAVAACAAFAAAAVAANNAGNEFEAKSLAAHAAFAASALSGTGYADDEATIWSVAADASLADDGNHDVSERKAQAVMLRAIVGNPFSD